MTPLDDTIAAISTPPGEGGIGIIRLSGSEAVRIADHVFLSPKGTKLKDMKSHRLVYGFIIDRRSGRRVDEVLVTVMRAPYTYTKENVVEINCHGGSLPLRETLRLLLLKGARLAEPGEFTRRAFLNGRIDLSQAEAVIDLIRAKTDQAERLALQQLEGRLSVRIRGLRDSVTDLCVHVEAHIDFPEDEIETVEKTLMLDAMDRIGAALTDLSAGYDEGRLFREGVAAAIVGKPNVGKSSLLNALLETDRAIVTEMPGTTRDVIEDYLNINGLPLRIMDTAGIRETHDLAEMEGVRRSLKAIDHADIVLAVFDASRPIDDADRELLEKVTGKKTLWVINKCDVLSPQFRIQDIEVRSRESETRSQEPETGLQQAAQGTSLTDKEEGELDLQDPESSVLYPAVRVSAVTGDGIERLKKIIHVLLVPSAASPRATAGPLQESHGESVLVTNVRHKYSTDRALAAIAHAKACLGKDEPLEVVALYLRECLDHLGEIVGIVTTEDILDRIFNEFCIGK